MVDLYRYVGARIRELRANHLGKGVSQEELAKAIGITPNTISRWETAVYKPDLSDMEKMARYFGVSILDLLPPEHESRDRRVLALLRAAKTLPDGDLEELRRYAEFRRAQHRVRGAQRGGRQGPRSEEE